MIEHSPLPWREGPTEGIGQRGRLRVVDANGVQVADCEAPKATATTFVRHLPEDTANVAFILRACNNHEDLLAALKVACDHIALHGSRAVLEQLEVVIEKAEGPSE